MALEHTCLQYKNIKMPQMIENKHWQKLKSHFEHAEICAA